MMTQSESEISRQDTPEMTPERWQQITALLENILPCDPSERSALLRGLCAGDEALRREVESLLAFEEVPVTFLQQPLVPQVSECRDEGREQDRDEFEIGLRIGPYRVVGRLGTGGMGSVFLAEREDGFHQRVALKRIKRRTSSQEVLFRFENERQILADLEHPNIARILDGGTTSDKLPYFVMEHVEGQRIDAYCDDHRLTIRQRLELVLEICSALQLAHENLVVHRDLKPGNILVTYKGVPKLIDFGIAKHLEPNAAPHEVSTELGSGPMTLRYASPEQVQSQPITTASDVYSLGVLLYQLLSGHDPYPYDGGQVALIRSIAEQEPIAPSVAVGRTLEIKSKSGTEQRRPESVSWPRRLRPDHLRGRLAGDLDSIVLKALRKQPHNRYRSMEQLATDIRRHLEGQPITAREGTFRYLASKFLRRHRLALALSSAVLMTLVASGLAVAFMWRQAAEEEAQFERERAEGAERRVGILSGLLEIFDPNAIGKQTSPLKYLRLAQREISEELRSEPEILADLLNDPLAKIYGRLGQDGEARAAREEALIILRTLYGEEHPKIAEVLLNLGANFFRMGERETAERFWRQAIEMRQNLDLDVADFVIPWSNLAARLAGQGRLDEAVEQYREVLAIQEELHGSADPRLVGNLRNLGKLHFVRGEQDPAESLLQRALEIEVAAHGPATAEVASVRSTLGRVLHAQNRMVEAAGQLAESLELRRNLYETGHVAIARVEKNLASVLLELGDLPTAEVLLEQAQSVLRSSPSIDDWEIAELESLLGAYLSAIGESATAESCLVASYETLEASRGSEVIYTKQAAMRLVRLYETLGDLSQADEYQAVVRVGSND